jgi:hypothetical protein
LSAKLPEIYSSLASDLQRFFIRVPGSRGDTVPGILWFVTYATLLGLIFFGVLPWFWGFIIGVIALALYVAWSAIAAIGQGGYTDEGAVEADRWRRFKTYLLEIKKFGDLAAAQEIIDRYFGYAVALGVEEVVLQQTVELGGLRPLWMPSSSQPATSTQPGETGQAPRPASSRPGRFPWNRGRRPTRPSVFERPTLAGMSVQLGDGVRQASRELGSVLATAAGDAGSAGRTVVLNSLMRRREMEWKPNTPVSQVLDDILRQSVSDARAIQAREVERRAAARSRSGESSGGSWWDSGNGGSSRSSSRSNAGFGSSSRSFGGSSSSSSSRGSSTRSTSGGSRSAGGGRSGFR